MTSVTSIPRLPQGSRRIGFCECRGLVITSCTAVTRTGRGAINRQAAPSKFAGVANRHRFLRDLDHHAIDFGFQQIRRAQSKVNIESIDSQKQRIGA